MKVGDLIVVDRGHNTGLTGIIVEDYSTSERNKGKAWKVLLSNGNIRNKIAKTLEVINAA